MYDASGKQNCSEHRSERISGSWAQRPIKISLPDAFPRNIIPANRDHIPTPDIAQSWPHLSLLVLVIVLWFVKFRQPLYHLQITQQWTVLRLRSGQIKGDQSC